MRDRAGGRLMALALAAAVASSVPTQLSAQTAETCTLAEPLPATFVEAAPSTRFLSSGGEGEILVRKKYNAASAFHVFEVSGSDPKEWKTKVEYPVISVKPPPERSAETSKAYEGFTAADSSIVRFRVPLVAPARDDLIWKQHTFVVRICDKTSGDALAIVTAPVSVPLLAKLVSIAFLAVVYVLFAGAIARVRGKQHPLVDKYKAKYPALSKQVSKGWLQHLDPVVLTANALNKGSIQKLQVLLFSFLVSGMVLALVLRLGVLSDLSVTVALLLGISAVGAAVAQKTAASRDRLSFDSWVWLVQKAVLPITEEDQTGPRWSDLVMTNREFDIYKLQTLIFTVVVAIALLVSGEERLSSFAVPETLLGILGLSQVVYISGTLATPPSFKELDEAIKALSDLEQKVQTVVAHGVDIDQDGNVPRTLSDPPNPLTPLADRKKTAPRAMELYKKKADQVEIMLESTLGIEVKRKLLEPTLS